ncbi:MAG: alpha/beta hydrolase [Alphaproteobacteria bacterium]
MATLRCAGAELFYERVGSGPDIVWIPGGDNVGADWVDQVAAFRADFRNTTYDPRGAGQTRALVPPPWTIEDFAADCAELIRAVTAPPVFLVGLSMGAKIVQELALSYPELVRCAIPMGASGRNTGYLREWEEAEIAFRRAGGSLPEAMAVAHYAVLMYPPEVLGDDALWAKVRPFVAASYGERDGAELAAQWQACLDYVALDRLPGCRVPIHVIAFSHDMQTPPAHGRRIAEAAGDGHFHLLEGLAHLSLRGHKPEVVNAKIREIIEAYL